MEFVDLTGPNRHREIHEPPPALGILESARLKKSKSSSGGHFLQFIWAMMRSIREERKLAAATSSRYLPPYQGTISNKARREWYMLPGGDVCQVECEHNLTTYILETACQNGSTVLHSNLLHLQPQF